MHQEQDIADALHESLAYFNRYCRYSLKRLAADYQEEIDNYQDDVWEAPQRAARLSAAVKNYKTSRMIEFIFYSINIIFSIIAYHIPALRLRNRQFGKSPDIVLLFYHTEQLSITIRKYYRLSAYYAYTPFVIYFNIIT